MISEVEPQSWISRVTTYCKHAKDSNFKVGQHVLKTHPKTKDLSQLIEKEGDHGFKYMTRDEMKNIFETDESGKTSARNSKRVIEASDETSSRTQKRVRKTTDETQKDVMETPARTRKNPVVLLTNCSTTNVPAVTQKSGEAPNPKSQQKRRVLAGTQTSGEAQKPKRITKKPRKVLPPESHKEKQKRLQGRKYRALKLINAEITTDKSEPTKAAKSQPPKAAKKSTTKSQPPKAAKKSTTKSQPTKAAKSQPPQEVSPVVYAIKSKVFNVAVDGASKSDEEEEDVTVEEEEDVNAVEMEEENVTDEEEDVTDDEEEDVAGEEEDVTDDEEEDVTDDEEEDVAGEEEEASQVVNAVSNVEMDGTRKLEDGNAQLMPGSREERSDGDDSIVERTQMTSEPSKELSFGQPLNFENSSLMETIIDDVLLFHSLAEQ